MRIAAIILAGGQGTRFGAKKQFIELNGKPLWRHARDRITKFINNEDIVVVGVDTAGGVTRSQSVINGLNALTDRANTYDRLIIAEAARPLITSGQLGQITTITNPSCTFVMPLTSTVVTRDGDYLDRNKLYKLSTPVAFDFNLFREAYLSGKYHDFTDDTRIMYEHYGIRPYFLEGGENLFKVTYPKDIAILELLLGQYPE